MTLPSIERAGPTTSVGAAHPTTLVIGVDGGGTKTLAWLATREAGAAIQPLGRGLAGPGNPRAAGFEVAQVNIAAAIAAAFADAGLPVETVAAACLGLSGAGRSEEQERIRHWAEGEGIAARVRVTHDAETILATADADVVGIALIAGTGSLAWGRNAAGAVGRTGGWGYLLGDEGGGYWIALAGLRAAVRAADGRGQPTHLLPRLMTALGAAQPMDLIGKVYAPETTRERLAELAPIICDCAATDGVAAEIVAQAAEELARMTGTLARTLQLGAGQYALALVGGVISGPGVIRTLLLERLHELGLPPRGVLDVTEPVAGAVTLARRVAASG